MPHATAASAGCAARQPWLSFEQDDAYVLPDEMVRNAAPHHSAAHHHHVRRSHLVVLTRIIIWNFLFELENLYASLARLTTKRTTPCSPVLLARPRA